MGLKVWTNADALASKAVNRSDIRKGQQSTFAMLMLDKRTPGYRMWVEENFPIPAHLAERDQAPCGGCVACCKVIGVDKLEKEPWAWCPHCELGKGCSVYENRPLECIEFACGYKIFQGTPVDWRPDKLKVLWYLVPDHDTGKASMRLDELANGALDKPRLLHLARFARDHGLHLLIYRFRGDMTEPTWLRTWLRDGETNLEICP